MYNTHLRGGKDFTAEQKICELKRLLLRSTCIGKFKGKHIKPNELIKKATFNLTQSLQNTDIHKNKLKNKHLILIQENTFKKFMILIVW